MQNQISQEEKDNLIKKYISQIEDLMKIEGLTKEQSAQLDEVHEKLVSGFYNNTRF